MADTTLSNQIDNLVISNPKDVVKLYSAWLEKSHGKPPSAGSEWADEHSELNTAKKLRDQLLEAAKLELLKGRKGSEPLATRAFLWTLESKKEHYDSLTAKAGANQNRFPIANTYDLGEALVARSSDPPSLSTSLSGGAKVHHECSKIRAELRRDLDDRCRQVLDKPKSGNAGDRSVLVVRQEFIALDLACCFEWRKNALEQYQRAFEDFKKRIEISLKAPPQVPAQSDFAKNPDDSKHVSLKELSDKVREDEPIALITVNDNEFRAVFELLEPPTEGKVRCCETLMGAIYLGKFAGRTALLAQSEMGSGGLLAAHSATRLILDNFESVQLVLAIGVCFGVDRSRQKFGDIVIAETIIPYEPQRINPSGLPAEDRGRPIPAGPLLLKAFTDWNGANTQGFPCSPLSLNVHIGAVLSGEKLIDDKPFRDDLVARWSNVQGGEMEGFGAYAACFGRPGVQVLLVKSICDFADGIKDKLWQPFAAKAAAEFCKKVLEEETDQINLCLLKPSDSDTDQG